MSDLSVIQAPPHVGHRHEVPVLAETPSEPIDRFVDELRCERCGLTLLGLVLSSPAWVHRRVESVSFSDHRTVRRRISVDFSMPETAPTVVVGRTVYRLVPLTIMRRKSLINFDLHDEADRPVPLLGLRQNQAITHAMAEAFACTVLHITEPPSELTAFLTAMVAGTQAEMLEEYRKANGDQPGAAWIVLELMRIPLFKRLLDRLTEDFVMFVLVPDTEPTRRVFKFRYDEPLSRNYRQAKSEATGWASTPAVPWWHKQPLLAALGWRPARVRFPTPAAEHSRSYHFEVRAPVGTEIVSAQILAGRPGPDPGPPWPSVDVVTGRFSTVDLHVVDVPRGCLSRAQVDLRVAFDSWLVLAVAAAWLTVAAVVGAAWCLGRLGGPGDRRLDPSATSALFITFAAAIAVMLWRPPEHRMAVRLASMVGVVAQAPSLILLVTAALFVFADDGRLRYILWSLGTPAVLVALTLSVTAVCTASHARRRKVKVLSPWEQGRLIEEIEGARHADARLTESFDAAACYLDFGTPAIKVASAESDSASPLPIDSELAEEIRRLIVGRLTSHPATTCADRDDQSRSCRMDH
jgi:hypothetical protein